MRVLQKAVPSTGSVATSELEDGDLRPLGIYRGSGVEHLFRHIGPCAEV